MLRYEPKSDLPCGRAQPTPSTCETETRIAGRGGPGWDDEAVELSARGVVIHDFESHAVKAIDVPSGIDCLILCPFVMFLRFQCSKGLVQPTSIDSTDPCRGRTRFLPRQKLRAAPQESRSPDLLTVPLPDGLIFEKQNAECPLNSTAT